MYGINLLLKSPYSLLYLCILIMEQKDSAKGTPNLRPKPLSPEEKAEIAARLRAYTDGMKQRKEGNRQLAVARKRSAKPDSQARRQADLDFWAERDRKREVEMEKHKQVRVVNHLNARLLTLAELAARERARVARSNSVQMSLDYIVTDDSMMSPMAQLEQRNDTLLLSPSGTVFCYGCARHFPGSDMMPQADGFSVCTNCDNTLRRDAQLLEPSASSGMPGDFGGDFGSTFEQQIGAVPSSSDQSTAFAHPLGVSLDSLFDEV